MNSILDDFKMAFRSGNILNQLIIINLAVFVVLNIGVFVISSMVGQPGTFDIVRYYLSVPAWPYSSPSVSCFPFYLSPFVSFGWYPLPTFCLAWSGLHKQLFAPIKWAHPAPSAQFRCLPARF